jgi:hypothetical protein
MHEQLGYDPSSSPRGWLHRFFWSQMLLLGIAGVTGILYLVGYGIFHAYTYVAEHFQWTPETQSTIITAFLVWLVSTIVVMVHMDR